MAKKTKSEMSEFFAESVSETLLPVVKANTNFVVTDNADIYYIGMCLDTIKIGGFNKKSKNDSAKGSIIEHIKGGQIDAYITEELNNDNKLLFIPTVNTLDYLNDYSMFTSVEYEFVKIDKSMHIVSFTGILAPYAKFRAIAAGQVKITDFVTSENNAVADVITTTDDTTSHAAAVAEKAKTIAASVASAVSAGAGKVAEKVKDKFAETSGISDMQEEDDDVFDSHEDDELADIDNDDDANDNNQGPEQEIVYTEAQVTTAIERIFHADNLDLPLSSEPFDQIFTINNHLIKFDTDQRDGYVNAELNRMASDANRDLLKFRTDNIKKLRDKYFNLMALRIEDIQRTLDTEDVTKGYGSLKSSIIDNKSRQMDSLSTAVEKRQTEIEKAFEERLKEAEENAARQARADFKARYQRQHNDDLTSVESAVKADIQSEYTVAMNELYTARRSDALTILDLNITAVLNELANDYQQIFDEENALYISKADAMREYSKQLHIDDAKRLAVEEEHLRITNEVNDARMEAAAKIALIQKEFETANAALEARAAATIAQAETTNDILKEQMHERTKALEDDKQALQARLDEALDKANRAHEIVKTDYERRLTQAQDDRDSWKQTLDSYKEQHKHNNRLATILVVAITIACVAGGFVAGGVYWNKFVAGNTVATTEEYEIKVIDPTKQEDDAANDISEQVTSVVTEAITTTKSAKTTTVKPVETTVETTKPAETTVITTETIS